MQNQSVLKSSIGNCLLMDSLQASKDSYNETVVKTKHRPDLGQCKGKAKQQKNIIKYPTLRRERGRQQHYQQLTSADRTARVCWPHEWQSKMQIQQESESGRERLAHALALSKSKQCIHCLAQAATISNKRNAQPRFCLSFNWNVAHAPCSN